MPTFSAFDGTRLAYRVSGEGAPLICLPGGMQDSVYLGELGGLSAHRQLVVLDLRGTGRSATPTDPASYRCDRLVDDVEALRQHLGLERIDLLGHSAGANITTLYASRHPERVGRLALITPSTRAVGIAPSAAARRAFAQRRTTEPWFAEAFAALEAIMSGTGDDWEAVAPFFRGRWDAAARAHHAVEGEQTNQKAAEVFGAEGAFDPDATRAALAAVDAPVLLLAGQVDLGAMPDAVAEFAGLFANAEFTVQAGAGHFPWMDDAEGFVGTTAAFLG